LPGARSSPTHCPTGTLEAPGIVARARHEADVEELQSGSGRLIDGMAHPTEKRPTRGLLLCIAAVAAALPAGCVGSSSTHTAVGDGKVWGSTANLPPGVDTGTERTLLTEWRAARFGGGNASGCRSRPGAFSTGKRLLTAMRRMNPAVPATDDLDATMALANFVFVLPDSNPNRLDIARADASGRYVHLVAVGAEPPRLRVGAL
jgi:hypothetical protein